MGRFCPSFIISYRFHQPFGSCLNLDYDKGRNCLRNPIWPIKGILFILASNNNLYSFQWGVSVFNYHLSGIWADEWRMPAERGREWWWLANANPGNLESFKLLVKNDENLKRFPHRVGCWPRTRTGTQAILAALLPSELRLLFTLQPSNVKSAFRWPSTLPLPPWLSDLLSI